MIRSSCGDAPRQHRARPVSLQIDRPATVPGAEDTRLLWELLREIEQQGAALTDWEEAFVADMLDRDDARPFSRGQAEQIRRIHRERVPSGLWPRW